MLSNSGFEVKPVPLRPLVFRTFLFIVISAFISLTIGVNYYISGIDMPYWIFWSILILLIVILIIDWIYTFISYSNAFYKFYPDRVQLFRETINPSLIDRVELKRGLFDMLMKTGNIIIFSSGKKYVIRYVYEFERIKNYLNSMTKNASIPNHKL